MKLPAGLPAPVARWLSLVAEVDGMADIDASGTGSLRQAVVGRVGTWLPLTFGLRLRPARLFAWEATVRVLGVRKVRSAEEYVSSRGRLIAGSRVIEGEQIDRAEYALLWAWTLALAPSAALRRSGVTWEAAGSNGARILFPYESEILEARLSFDSESGFLQRFETRRFELRAGFPRIWSVELGDYRAVGGLTAPASVVIAWDGEPAIRLELERTELRG